MSDIDINFHDIGVQVSKDWHDGDTMQLCKIAAHSALSDPVGAVGSGQDGQTDGFTSLISALSEAQTTFEDGFQTLHEAFTVLGSNDTAVGDGYRSTDNSSGQGFNRIAGRMSAS